MNELIRYYHISYTANKDDILFVSTSDSCVYCVDVKEKTIALKYMLSRSCEPSCAYRVLREINDVLYVFPYDKNSLLLYNIKKEN